MIINIYLYSKNFNSLKSFLKCFTILCVKKNFKINFFLKFFQTSSYSNIFTILKSPHVNKQAQEQFEYKVFSKQVNVYSFQMLKLLIVLKKVQIKLFPDIKIKIKFLVNNKNSINIELKTLNPNTFIIYFLNNKNIKNIDRLKCVLNYLKLFDIYGEIKFKYNF